MSSTRQGHPPLPVAAARRAGRDHPAQVLDAARTLFAAQGYPATTVAAIAREAGVAAKTVYLAFGSKSGVLRALWDLTLKGDDSPAPVAERPWYVEVLEEPDPEQQLRRNARNARTVKERIAPVLQVVRDGAPVDTEVAALWELIQTDFHANQKVIVESLDAKQRAGRGPRRRHGHRHPLDAQPPRRLVPARRALRLDPDRFETWFADTCCAQLLPPGPTR